MQQREHIQRDSLRRLELDLDSQCAAYLAVHLVDCICNSDYMHSYKGPLSIHRCIQLGKHFPVLYILLR